MFIYLILKKIDINICKHIIIMYKIVLTVIKQQLTIKYNIYYYKYIRIFIYYI